MRIADSLFGSKGPTKYDVVEIKTTSEGNGRVFRFLVIGEYKKRSKCVKGKHLDAWFREKLMHTARKPDNAKRIFTENINVWNKKYVYSWDYDGPAVRH